eukprot:11470286-Ditylum_brightwellii.AAC.1
MSIQYDNTNNTPNVDKSINIFIQYDANNDAPISTDVSIYQTVGNTSNVDPCDIEIIPQISTYQMACQNACTG